MIERVERVAGAAPWAALAVLLVLGWATEAGATLLPGLRWAGSFGGTRAIASLPKDLNQAYGGGDFGPAEIDWNELSDRGGRSLKLAVMSPVGERFSVGGELFADDLSTLIVALREHTGELLDAREFGHSAAWGAGWRVDMDVWNVPEHKAWRIPKTTIVATGTAGLWRVTEDYLRRRVHEEDAFGWSLGMGWQYQLPGRVSVGPAFRYHRVFSDRVGRYVTVALDWGWR